MFPVINQTCTSVKRAEIWCLFNRASSGLVALVRIIFQNKDSVVPGCSVRCPDAAFCLFWLLPPSFPSCPLPLPEKVGNGCSWFTFASATQQFIDLYYILSLVYFPDWNAQVSLVIPHKDIVGKNRIIWGKEVTSQSCHEFFFSSIVSLVTWSPCQWDLLCARWHLRPTILAFEPKESFCVSPSSLCLCHSFDDILYPKLRYLEWHQNSWSL